MLVTESKEKLPKGYSYPLGLKKISQALNHLTHHKRTSIKFWWRDGYWKSEWQKRIKSKGTLRLMYVSSDIKLMNYNIHLYSVPSQYNKIAKDLLLDKALPMLNLLLIQDEDNIKYINETIKFNLLEYQDKLITD